MRVHSVQARFGTAVATAAVVATSTLVTAAPAGAMTLAPSGEVVVYAQGNGHGHGMSQYGAQGAALAGKSYRQILKFYYPGTTLKTLPKRAKIRVQLSDTGRTVQVRAEPRLRVTGVDGVLPSAGISYYRLVTDPGRTLSLQARARGSARWTTVARKLANRSAFYRGSRHSVRLHYPAGYEIRYFGNLRAVRSGSGVMTVNVLGLDYYTRGVVPYEMPTSWKSAAVAAQAVAARTYGRYAVEHPRNREYDICDTTSCQVYGGFVQFSKSGAQVRRDARSVILGNRNQVLRYRGKTIFAEFSASNGGYSTNGNHPYLVAKADPYDAARGANPYRPLRKSVSVSQLAGYFGLKKAKSIAITKRDGRGAWGGRVLAGTVTGTNANGRTVRVSFSGSELQWALGLGTTLIKVG